MKKQLIIAALAIGVSASAFAQGFFNAIGSGASVKQTFTTGTSVSASGNVDIAFLWGSGTSLISQVGSSSSTASFTTNSAVVWADLLSDPSYQLATNFSNGNLLFATTGTGLGAGNFSIGDVGATNSLASTTYNVIVIGWNSAFATPQLAAAANAAVGWSSPFSYTTGTSISTLPTFSTAGLTAFGVDPVSAVPEPGTMALAGLGGLSMLLFRRRNS